MQDFFSERLGKHFLVLDSQMWGFARTTKLGFLNIFGRAFPGSMLPKLGSASSTLGSKDNKCYPLTF